MPAAVELHACRCWAACPPLLSRMPAAVELTDTWIKVQLVNICWQKHCKMCLNNNVFIIMYLTELHCTQRVTKLHCTQRVTKLHCTQRVTKLHCTQRVTKLHCAQRVTKLHYTQCSALHIGVQCTRDGSRAVHAWRQPCSAREKAAVQCAREGSRAVHVRRQPYSAREKAAVQCAREGCRAVHARRQLFMDF